MKIDMRRTLVLLFSLALLLTAAQPAFAADAKSLLRHLPRETRLVIGVDVPRVKKSVLFSEFKAMLNGQAAGTDLMNFLFDPAAFNLEKDVQDLVIGMGEPNITPNAPTQQDLAVVVSGKVDEKKVLSAARKRFGKLAEKKYEGRTVYEASDFSLAFVDKSTALLVSKGAFESKVWKALAAEKSSAKSSPDLSRLLGQVDTKKGIWLLANTKGLPQAQGPSMQGAAITLDLVSGLQIEVHSNMATVDEAKKALTEIETMKKESAKNPFVAMLGAQPLVDNLKVSMPGKKSTVVMKTRMSEGQVKTMVKQLKALSQSQMAPPTTMPSPGTGKPATGGAEADFN